jgi:3-oxoacyl-[acyl-carrier-protein] synthase III
VVAGWGAATGSRRVEPEEVDRAFGMPVGKLRGRAGIESLRYAAEEESEVTLGVLATRKALELAKRGDKEVDWVMATSETYLAYPSLAARLHRELGLRENCGALDVGGACLGLLHGLAVAQSFLLGGAAWTILVVSADVHSRTLRPGRVAGEFGGLFGDGASAFVVGGVSGDRQTAEYRLGEFEFGCASQYAEAICLREALSGKLEVRFDGEALSRAAISRLERVVSAIETKSGIARTEVGAFATHQPNPRLVTLLAKQCGVAAELFPAVARVSGNLGSSTCGVALAKALEASRADGFAKRKPIFLASLGPGLLYGGGWLFAESLRSPEQA